MSESLESLRSELRTLNEGLSKNMTESRQIIESFETRLKTGESTVDELRANLTEVDNQFVEMRQKQKEISEKIDRLSVIRIATTEEQRALNHQKLNGLMKRMYKGAERGAFGANLSDEEKGFLYPEIPEVRALGSMFDADGGALIPTDFENLVYKAMYTLPGFRGVVTGRPTGTNLASVITMGDIDAQWIGESESTTGQTTDFGNVQIPIHQLRVEIAIPRNLLDDSAVNLVAELTDSVAMKIAEKEDVAFISGNGNKKPNGLFVSPILQTSGNYVASGVSNNIYDGSNNGVDKLRTMPTKLKQVHRVRGSYMMSAQTEVAIRNLKDSYGQYLYHTNVAQGKPNTFDGYPIAISDNCPSIAANAFPIAFGDFNNAYAIRDRQGLTTEIDFSIYRKTDKVAIFVKKRVGGMPVITETPAVCLMKIATS